VSLTAGNGATPVGRQTDISHVSQLATGRVIWFVSDAVACWHKCRMLSSRSTDSPALYFKTIDRW